MNGFLAYLTGSARLTVTGASPQDYLNLLTREGIAFWSVERSDELHYHLCVPIRNEEQARKLATRCFCTVELTERRGLPVLLRKALRRPVLLLGAAVAIALIFLLQSRIWVIEVKGNDRVPQETILRALAELGIKPGENADYEPQRIKMQMLNAVPELSWLAANRTGGKITVLVTERDIKQEGAAKPPAGSLVASSDGVITDYSISEGMRLISRGDTVTAGQILVSGLEDYGLCLRAVCAEGEIYAQTWRAGCLVTPAYSLEKKYTGREWTEVSLLIGRKRIKICGNSGKTVGSCDKMINVKRLRLPGYAFPIALETAVYREYTLSARPKDPAAVRRRLENAWETQTCADMIAGVIGQTDYRFSRSDALCVLRAESACNEMIARLVPLFGQHEGENDDGTHYQRRTD